MNMEDREMNQSRKALFEYILNKIVFAETKQRECN